MVSDDVFLWIAHGAKNGRIIQTKREIQVYLVSSLKLRKMSEIEKISEKLEVLDLEYEETRADEDEVNAG